MDITENKKNGKEKKRLLIIEAAEKLILEKGLEKLNMDEVAEEAGVSKGALYLYFQNKDDLVLGICAKASHILGKNISQILTQDLSGIEMVREIGKEFLNFVSTHPEYFSSMRFYDHLRNTENLCKSDYISHCQANRDTAFTSMVRAIQIGMQDKTINPNFDPKELALVLWGTSMGMVNLAYLHQNTPHFELIDKHQIDVSKLLESYMAFVGSGIAANPKLTASNEGATKN